MPEVIEHFFNLLGKFPSLYLKLNRNQQVLQIVSDQGKVYEGFESVIGKAPEAFVESSLLPHFTKAVFETSSKQSINTLTINQALHPGLPFSLKLQFVPLENQAVGVVVSTFKEDYTSTSFYNKVPVMILYLDKEENILWANEHFYRKSNLDKDIIGESVRGFLRINTRISQIDSLRAKQSHIRTEYKLIGRKRTRLIVIASAVEQYDEEGNFLCMTVVLRDITKMKNAQTELEYQKMALDEAAIVAVTDVRGDIVYVNDKFCEVSQYERKELIGKNHRIIKSGEHPPELFEDMWATIYAGEVWRGEICNIKKDGSKYWVYTTIIPFLNERGRPFRYQAIRFEVTKRKAMEKQIKKYTDHLEELVGERTEELAQQTENLYAANRELSVINQRLDRKNNSIQQSINYAKRIQEAILPRPQALPLFVKDYFVLYKPKDIVSGDFYWWHTDIETESLILAAVDCTGHGVPGAFMSMIGSTVLDEIVKNKKVFSPAKVLRQMRIEIGEILHQNTSKNRDGMDMAILNIDYKNQSVVIAGAKNGVLVVDDKDSYYIKGDRMSIGGRIRRQKEFTEHKILYTPKTKFYLFSDGYADQFGGEDGQEKFSGRRLKSYLKDISYLPMKTQKEKLSVLHKTWKIDTKQIDDILVMGLELA